MRPKVWHRWSDQVGHWQCTFFYIDIFQCSAQFKSMYTLQDLYEAPERFNFAWGAVVLWHYFEVGEGKNESDSLGSIIKLAFKRAVLRETDRAISSPEDVAAMIRSCLQETTSKYDFIRIIVAPQIDRDPKPKGIPHRGIQSRHSFVRSADGIIYARDLSCPQCISTGQVCEECRTSCKIAYRPAHVNISVDEDDEDVDVDEELDQLYDNAVDISLSEGEETDQESSDEDEEEVPERYAPGCQIFFLTNEKKQKCLSR